MPATLHLLRHGSYAALGRILAGRAEGWPLTPAGVAEAERLAERLSRRPIAAVLSSPILRARQTAAPIAARCGLETAIEPGITEIDFGAWTGSAFAALHGDPSWQAWNRHRGLAPIPGGETMAQAQARALDAVCRLCRAWPDGELVLVSHADVIKAVLSNLLGTPLDLMHRMAIDPASRSVIRVHPEGAEVLGINLPPDA